MAAKPTDAGADAVTYTHKFTAINQHCLVCGGSLFSIDAAWRHPLCGSCEYAVANEQLIGKLSRQQAEDAVRAVRCLESLP